jgi:hypothetical protein
MRLRWIHCPSRDGIGCTASERLPILPVMTNWAPCCSPESTYHGRAGHSTSFRNVHRRSVQIDTVVLLPSAFRFAIVVRGDSRMAVLNSIVRGPGQLFPKWNWRKRRKGDAASPSWGVADSVTDPTSPAPRPFISNRNTAETGFPVTHSKQRTVVFSNRNKKPPPRGVPSQLLKVGSTRGVAPCPCSRPDHRMGAARGLGASQPASLKYTIRLLLSAD